jgi:hypothetical protein
MAGNSTEESSLHFFSIIDPTMHIWKWEWMNAMEYGWIAAWTYLLLYMLFCPTFHTHCQPPSNYLLCCLRCPHLFHTLHCTIWKDSAFRTVTPKHELRNCLPVYNQDDVTPSLPHPQSKITSNYPMMNPYPYFTHTCALKIM